MSTCRLCMALPVLSTRPNDIFVAKEGANSAQIITMCKKMVGIVI